MGGYECCPYPIIMQNLQTKDPTPHVKQIHAKLRELCEHLKEDGKKVDDPSAAALFETSAEVLTGLERAFEHFEAKSEAAWKKS